MLMEPHGTLCSLGHAQTWMGAQHWVPWDGMGWEKAVTCLVLGTERAAVRCEVVSIPRCPGTVQPWVLTHGANKPVPRSLDRGGTVLAPAQLTWYKVGSSHLDAQTHVPIASTSGHQ